MDTLSVRAKFNSVTSAMMTCRRLEQLRLSRVRQTYCIRAVCVHVGVCECKHISVLGIARISKNLSLLHAHSPAGLWFLLDLITATSAEQWTAKPSASPAAKPQRCSFHGLDWVWCSRTDVSQEKSSFFPVSQTGSWSFSVFLSSKYLQTPTASSLQLNTLCFTWCKGSQFAY